MEIKTPLKLSGEALAWDDLIIEPTSRLLSPETPLFRQFLNDGKDSRGVYLYHFDGMKDYETELYFTVQMPHKWAHTPICPHVHWSPTITSQKGDCVVWGLEYSWTGIGQVFSDTRTIYAGECVDSYLIERKHYLSSFGSIKPIEDEFGLSSILVGRLFRNTKNSLDTYDYSAALLYIDIHYEINRLGSEEELH